MNEVLVLGYHALSPTWEADLSVTPDALEKQIGHLLTRGWRPATFADAVLRPPRPRTLAITFDDAFASVKEFALPILTRLQAVATVFAPTDFMSGAEMLTWPGIDHYPPSDSSELRPMDWNDLGELVEHGWEIGSHTCTHPRLTQLDESRLERELSESRGLCSERLGRECTTIAYPYGDVDERVASAAGRAGYLAGGCLSSNLRGYGPLRHPRIGIYHADVAWRFRLKAARPMRALRASSLWARAEGERS